MFDVEVIGSMATTLLSAVVAWLPGQRPMLLLVEIVVWFAAVSGLGVLLAELRAIVQPARPWPPHYAAQRVPAERRRWCSRLLVPEQGAD